MSKVITFSRNFQKSHPKAGEPTLFVEKILRSIYLNYGSELNEHIQELRETIGFDVNKALDAIPKHHTIRSGNRWNIGDKFSPRVWSGKPYCSKQIIIAPDIEIRKIWRFEINEGEFLIEGRQIGSLTRVDLAINDGLDYKDMLDWFKFPKPFSGQIICWNQATEY